MEVPQKLPICMFSVGLAINGISIVIFLKAPDLKYIYRGTVLLKHIMEVQLLSAHTSVIFFYVICVANSDYLSMQFCSYANNMYLYEGSHKYFMFTSPCVSYLTSWGQTPHC